MKGIAGKVLMVDLTKNKIKVIEEKDVIYRKYMGGVGLALYYLMKEIKPDADPLSPENVMVIAPGLLTGSPAPAVPRYTICAKSPLTGGLGKSEAGGFWGPELKRAGYDALVIKGKADHPVYLKIVDDQIEIVDASHLWGKTTAEAERLLKQEVPRSRVLQIGPAGENLVLYANICNNLAHFNGRNGLGAVMGSKNLKAVVVRGTGRIDYYDKERLINTTKWVAENYKEHPLARGLHEGGTAAGVAGVNAGGTLPTNNWNENYFATADKISGQIMNETILINRKGCYSCPIRCKRVVELEEERFSVNPELGGPEYETLVALGSNCGIDDLNLLAKANEMCNQYALDTISLGMTISFAMNCFEEGLLTLEDTDGLELRFGNKDILLRLIEMTAKRQGFGSLLAEGSARMAEKIGRESYKYLREVKKQEIPMHDPRVKTGLALQYALSPHGADHWVAQHDPFFTQPDSLGMEAIAPLGIYEPVPAVDLSSDKVRLFYYTHLLVAAYDCLGVCVFGYVARSMVPLDMLVELVKGVTGWKTSLWELLKVGERISNMMRLFNVKQGFTKEDDRIPDLFFEDIKTGPLQGKNALDKEEFDRAISSYYKMAGWTEEGVPANSKLKELGLDSFM